MIHIYIYIYIHVYVPNRSSVHEGDDQVSFAKRFNLQKGNLLKPSGHDRNDGTRDEGAN